MILLTGATGFLGREMLQQFLDAGLQVRALIRNPEKAGIPSHPLLEIAEGEILDVVALEKAMEGVTHVVHSAAIVSFWKKRREEMRRTNVTGTANVVNAALDAGVKKFINISSVAALGRTSSGITLDETTKWKDSSLNTYYGYTKYRAELEVMRGVEEGLSAVNINPGVIMGVPRSGKWDSGTPHMFHMLARGLKWCPHGFTGFVSSADVALAVRLHLSSDFTTGERFILVSENRYYKDLFAVMAKGLGVKPPTRMASPFLARIGGRINEIMSGFSGKEPLITRETARTSGYHYTYVNKKILSLPGFQFRKLDDTLMETAAAYVEQHHN